MAPLTHPKSLPRNPHMINLEVFLSSLFLVSRACKTQSKFLTELS